MKYGRRTTSIARQQAAQQLAEQNESDWTDWLPTVGTGVGAALAIPSGGLSTIASSAALGGMAGSGLGTLAGAAEEPAKLGPGAVGLARLATDRKSAEIIERVLQGWK